MAKTEMTRLLESAIYRETSKMGTFGCFEVTIGWYGKERVDYMTYNTRGEFRCYEIKVSKADFHSKCRHTFVGHFGYYVMTPELYELVKAEIPAGIGVYTSSGRGATCVKKARRKEPEVDIQILKDSLIRSLSREVDKQIDSDDDLLIERKNREISQLRRERDSYYRECWDLRKKYHPDYRKRDAESE